MATLRLMCIEAAGLFEGGSVCLSSSDLLSKGQAITPV